MKRQKQSQEDYLRTLYILWEKDKNIHSKKIADYLNISKPSVSAMLNKLQQKKYINKKPYGTVNLTKKGLVKAKEITRRHRLIEVFLKKSLGLKNENIHQEAHHLEHAFSDLSIKKLEKILKNPKKMPARQKNTKINKKCLDEKDLEKRKNIPLQGKSLADYPAGTDIEITGTPGGPGFRQRLGELGLYEGAKAKIIKNDRFGPVILKVFNSKIALGQHQAKRTYVKKV